MGIYQPAYAYSTNLLHSVIMETKLNEHEPSHWYSMKAKGHTIMATSTHPLLHPASFLPHPGKPVL